MPCQTAMPRSARRSASAAAVVLGMGRARTSARGPPSSAGRAGCSVSGSPARKRSPSARSCADDRVPAERLEVRDRRDEAREQLVRLRPGLEAVPERLVGRRAAPCTGASAPSSSAARPRQPEVRPVELVRRADQHVDAGRGDVDRPVRRVVDGVDPGERARPRGPGRPRARRRRACRARSTPTGRRRRASARRAVRSRSSRSSRPSVVDVRRTRPRGRGRARARARARRWRRGRAA